MRNLSAPILLTLGTDKILPFICALGFLTSSLPGQDQGFNFGHFFFTPIVLVCLLCSRKCCSYDYIYIAELQKRGVFLPLKGHCGWALWCI